MREIWKSAAEAVIAGDVSTLERLLGEHAELFEKQTPPPYVPRGPGPSYAGGDARAIVAREHRFPSFDEFSEYTDALTQTDSAVARFESAVDAVIAGDVATLQRLLRDRPELVRARSTRSHHSTLLHYVGANGVEGFRQKTPSNAVEILNILLDAGAEVDAPADMYGGGSTTLGLVATSIHPELAGAQIALLETLLNRGATIDTGGRGAVIGCLHNGRGAAAEFLASRGARLDVEGAAGVGRLDLVERFFNEDEMKSAFAAACGYGRTAVVEFLIDRGMQVDARLPEHGQTGLHSAAVGAHVDTVELLLQRRAPIDLKDESFGGTPLTWALHGWYEQSKQSKRDRYCDVVALLIAAGATVPPAWFDTPPRDEFVEQVQADPRMLAALGSRA